ncbi:unnamed protein product [Trichogramma brassicae]|uniref:Uncharacterized protein n=1 Tax=Trichogramma brassicae TaxID=86971 RepID=A0A6H5J1U8_9HYME|nr:unnamed protein product [Trichogramma brassicae]CAB0044062.1 unnamed protein product [Trichogramma brassicae]
MARWSLDVHSSNTVHCTFSAIDYLVGVFTKSNHFTVSRVWLLYQQDSCTSRERILEQLTSRYSASA